ncbi:MAG: twin-arginine translocation signal domain-containing protein [Planctomycetales bacterium]|nr:twin-arginine translocation signal domain-containing protein [Planctomycetales bacterium]
MKVSRREFLKYCTASAAALGLGLGDLQRLEAALASSGAPTLIWLHGSGCQGDSVSFLNLFSDDFALPGSVLTLADVLITHVNLAYHTVVMASAAQTAVTMANQAKRKGGYVLVLEGGVPTAFGGRACIIATDGGRELTYQQAIMNLAGGAAAVVCVGTCASFGGIPMSGPTPAEANPTQVVSCKDAVLSIDPAKLVINIPGCPTHPEWVAWVVVQLILGNVPALDAFNRPQTLFGNKTVDPHMGNIHENCPRNPNYGGNPELATTFGQDNRCLQNLGCRGPTTFSNCPIRKWHAGENGPINWCVDGNAPCIGCVEPDFPGGDFYNP